MFHSNVEITQRLKKETDVYEEHNNKEFKISCSRCGIFFGEQATLSEAVAFAKGLVYPFGSIGIGDVTVQTISIRLNLVDTEFDNFNSDHVACMQAFSEGNDDLARELCN